MRRAEKHFLQKVASHPSQRESEREANLKANGDPMKTKMQKKKADWKYLSVRMKPELHKRIERHADAERRSMSAQMVDWAEEGLARTAGTTGTDGTSGTI